MPKSPDAFRTISEVADWLGIQAHVLRFWESKFTQVKPIKRAGGRRYYRPADMLLLGGIKKLLHDDGLTIKGVQKILREEGMSHVSAMSPPLDDADVEIETITAEPTPKLMQAPAPEPASVVLPFEAPKDLSNDAAEVEEVETASDEAPVSDAQLDKAQPEGDDSSQAPALEVATSVEEVTTSVESETAAETTPALDEVDPVATKDDTSEEVAEPVTSAPEPQPPEDAAPLKDLVKQPTDSAAFAQGTVPEQDEAPETAKEAELDEARLNAKAEDTVAPAPQDSDTTVQEEAGETAKAALPAFVRNQPEAEAQHEQPDAPKQSATTPEPEVPSTSSETTKAEPETTPEPESVAAEPVATPEPELVAPKPRDIGMPNVTPEIDIHAEIATLAHASRLRSVDAATAQKMAPLLDQLAALRDRMAARRGSAQPKF